MRVTECLLSYYRQYKDTEGRRALHCDKHQFCNNGEHSNCFQDIIVEQRKKKERIRKMVLLLLHTFAFSSSARLLGNYMNLADHKCTQRGSLHT